MNRFVTAILLILAFTPGIKAQQRAETDTNCTTIGDTAHCTSTTTTEPTTAPEASATAKEVGRAAGTGIATIAVAIEKAREHRKDKQTHQPQLENDDLQKIQFCQAVPDGPDAIVGTKLGFRPCSDALVILLCQYSPNEPVATKQGVKPCHAALVPYCDGHRKEKICKGVKAS